MSVDFSEWSAAQTPVVTILVLAAIGVVAMLGLQTMLIVGGNTQLLPLTGVTLPLISSGGSPLVSTFFALGMLCGITSLNTEDEARDIEQIEIRQEAML